MDGNGSARNCSKINSRVSHTIYQKTASDIPKSNKRAVPNACFKRNVCNNRQNEISGYSKSCSTLTELRLPSIFDTKARRVISTHIQSENVKQICKGPTIPFNKYVSHPRLLATSRLDVQNRPIAGIFPLKNFKVTQALPSPHLQPRTARNDLPSIRFKHCTQNVLNTNELDCPNITRTLGHPNHSLSRRLFNSKSECSRPPRSCANHIRYITRSWLASKFREICSLSTKNYNIFRDIVESLGQLKIPAKRKDFFAYQKSQFSSRSRDDICKRVAENYRTPKLCQLRCPSGPTQSPATINVHELATRPCIEILPTNTKCSKRTGMVDSQLSGINTPTLSSASTLPDNRCIKSWVGSSTEQSGCIGQLVARGTDIAFQSKRNASHITRPRRQRSPTPQQLDPDTMRQQDSRQLLKERRRYEIITPNRINLSNSEFTGPMSNTLQHTPSPRQVQQSCRPLITCSPSSRMAPNASLYANDICKVGNPNNRFVCLGDSSRSLQLCIPRPERPTSPVSRCIQCPLELFTCVDISTPILNSKSPNTPKSIDRDILNSSTTMGQGILARRPQSPSTSSAANSTQVTDAPDRHIDGASTPTSTENRPRSLEMWGWSEAVETWTPEQRLLLKNSWRKSTLKTYEVAWKRWTSWSMSKNIDMHNPTGTQLAQFLSDLHLIHNLSYNTIILHKSVVSTLCNAERSSQLSSHVLVKHILKSIALKNPKCAKPPIWDISQLITYLSNYTVNENNIFQISRHTAIILLLCSGRRIHDLTLLQVDPDHYIKSDDSVTLWPQFGSKTDCSTRRQSGWKLLTNPNNSNLNPIFWLEKTVQILHERRKASKSFNLFITVRGAPKPASRTVIAGWVKTLFKEAGIIATPGSTRSAVASKSWLENHPLDEILSRGNWQSAKTFQNFYRREVIRSGDSNLNVSELFNPVN